METTPTNLKSDAGFSLIEVTIALAIAAVSLLVVIGMMEPSMKMARDSADRTAIGAVLEDVHDRLEGNPLEVGTPAVSPLFYDQQGRYVSEEDRTDPERSPFFKVELSLDEFHNTEYFENTAGMLAFSAKLYWPITVDGTPLGNPAPKTTIAYPVTTLTGPDWREIEPGFTPKVEF